jgi:putative glutamine amidotransferase
MSIPVIGIVTSRILRNRMTNMYLNEAYVQAVSGAGAAPLLIPLGLSEEVLREAISRVDGVLFSGGGDMAPESYGSQLHPKVNEVDEDRDRVELVLYAQVLDEQKPFLGICRGFQVLNVAMGGTLYEDIADQHPGAIKHDYYPNIPRDHAAHSVQISEETSLARILGKPVLEVNSLHHQGIRHLAPGLKASAHAPDGLIEGVEVPEHPFGLAVQWHPEWLQAQQSMRQLLLAFVHAASQELFPKAK